MPVGMIYIKTPNILLTALSRSAILSEFWGTEILSNSLNWVSVLKWYNSAQGNYFTLLHSANPLRMVFTFSERATDF